MAKRTLFMVKPDAIKRGLGTRVMDRFATMTGLTLTKRVTLVLTHEQATEFYREHIGRPHFSEYLRFMSSGPVTAAVFEGNDAVNKGRAALGSWDPAKAQKGTLRGDYGKADARGILSIGHASDSDENADREIDFFFNRLIPYKKK